MLSLDGRLGPRIRVAHNATMNAHPVERPGHATGVIRLRNTCHRADPSTQRGPVEIARLSPCDKLYPSAIRHLTQRPEKIWGRRSLFTLGGKPLLVSEIFLPGIPPCP